MKNLRNKLTALALSATARDTYVLFFGNIVSFVFGIFFAILAAREIDPSDWGVFSAAGGFMIILFAFGEMGLGSGLFRFVSGLWRDGKKEESKKIESVVFSTRIVTATIFMSIMIVFASQISLLVFKSPSPWLTYFTAFGLLGSLLTDYQVSLLQAKGRWGTSSFIVALGNFFRLMLLLLLTYFVGSLSLVSLFAVFFLPPLVTFMVSLIFDRPTLSFSAESFVLFKKLSKFSVWMGINRSVGSISSRVDSIILLQLATPFEAGIVGAARQLSNAVLVLLSSFATVIAPRLASYTGNHRFKYFKKTIFLSGALSFALLVGILFVDPVISLLGPKYALSAGVLKWSLISLIPFAMSNPSVNALIYSFNKPHIIALLSIVELPLVILGNILLIPKFGVYGPVIVLALWNLMTLIVSYLFTAREFLRNKKL